MREISILGCGWLGLPLGQAFLEKGYVVRGSTTSVEKIPLLQELGISPFLITVNPDGVAGDVLSFLSRSDTLIIDIPPKLRGNASENFVSKIRGLIPFIEDSKVVNVVFISSISVYGENQGLVTASTHPEPVTESGKQLLESEQLLLDNAKFSTTIVRFGGLTGNNRHPVRQLAGRQDLDNPDAPINLIDISDCIGIVLSIVEQRISDAVFNAVAPYHPTRREYYTQKAAFAGLAAPHFNEQQTESGKIISSEHLRETLNYNFLVTDRI
ncbi:NAD(P)-dependent oxidoreductase [Flavobacterium magnum]|uniref:NAD(P)-dependent oxidoreductase n=1 Tax=Flavobacterium magnum TaxID=2162713 RepID=A0A2S0RBH5_9FLAO|nr:NAD(P)-dependent oxidoreductase [Flavobacterium magnum]AWA29377.1 NAD(P)-dependent oxidoreductase [Flavobacterium magnum]